MALTEAEKRAKIQKYFPHSFQATGQKNTGMLCGSHDALPSNLWMMPPFSNWRGFNGREWWEYGYLMWYPTCSVDFLTGFAYTLLLFLTSNIQINTFPELWFGKLEINGELFDLTDPAEFGVNKNGVGIIEPQQYGYKTPDDRYPFGYRYWSDATAVTYDGYMDLNPGLVEHLPDVVLYSDYVEAGEVREPPFITYYAVPNNDPGALHKPYKYDITETAWYNQKLYGYGKPYDGIYYVDHDQQFVISSQAGSGKVIGVTDYAASEYTEDLIQAVWHDTISDYYGCYCNRGFPLAWILKGNSTAQKSSIMKWYYKGIFPNTDPLFYGFKGSQMLDFEETGDIITPDPEEPTDPVEPEEPTDPEEPTNPDPEEPEEPGEPEPIDPEITISVKSIEESEHPYSYAGKVTLQANYTGFPSLEWDITYWWDELENLELYPTGETSDMFILDDLTLSNFDNMRVVRCRANYEGTEIESNALYLCSLNYPGLIGVGETMEEAADDYDRQVVLIEGDPFPRYW